MQNLDNANNESQIDDIDFIELFKILFKEKWLVFSSTSIFSIFAVIYSLSLPNIYESTALLSPNNPGETIPSSLQNYSSLANLAGLNLSTQSIESNATQAIKKLNSLSFYENHILPNIFLPDLMALKKWDSDKNKIIYDNNVYDESEKKWVRNFSFPQNQIPSAQESFEVFRDKHLTVVEDPKIGFVTVKIKHQSPTIAMHWTSLTIDQINAYYREKDKTEAERAVKYLNSQIANTNLSEIKQVIAALLQQETQKLTLVEANDSYVYEYIDPPVVMEKKSEPRRAFICIVIAIFGGIFGVILVFVRHYFFKVS